jgi:hypothetical protein
MSETVSARLHWADGRVQEMRNVDALATEIKVPRGDGTTATFRSDTSEIDSDGFVVFREKPYVPVSRRDHLDGVTATVLETHAGLGLIYTVDFSPPVPQEGLGLASVEEAQTWADDKRRKAGHDCSRLRCPPWRSI